MRTTKQYDYLNRLLAISSVPTPAQPKSGAAPTASFSYQYNPANQRTAVTNGDGSYWAYGYDSLGQVTNGMKYWADNTFVAGEQFQYGFDTIGNRLSAAFGGDQNSSGLRLARYQANNVNEYTSRDVPGYVEITGSAAAKATVSPWSVGGAHTAPYRKGSYFWGELALTNGQAPLWAEITNLASLSPGPVVSGATGAVFLAQTPEHFYYDYDGNLTNDGRWIYRWDAENRLIGMTNNAAFAPAVGLVFDYDWQGRRIQKQAWYNGALTNSTVFLYDGWNLLAATNSSLARLQSFLWGLDLSDSLQGAGGVGGLLAMNETASVSHFAAFDGNGNVAALVSATGGTNSATYEYGPFGELIRATGPLAKVNPFRFSAKYQGTTRSRLGSVNLVTSDTATVIPGGCSLMTL